MSDLDLPFEENPPGQTIDLSDANVSGGVVIMAAYANSLLLGRTPALVFRFAKADGTGFYPPMMLALADDQLTKIEPLVRDAVAAARKAATG